MKHLTYKIIISLSHAFSRTHKLVTCRLNNLEWNPFYADKQKCLKYKKKSVKKEREQRDNERKKMCAKSFCLLRNSQFRIITLLFVWLIAWRSPVQIFRFFDLFTRAADDLFSKYMLCFISPSISFYLSFILLLRLFFFNSHFGLLW